MRRTCPSCDEVGRLEAEARRQHAVARGRRAAALDVAEHRHARLEAGALLDLARRAPRRRRRGATWPNWSSRAPRCDDLRCSPDCVRRARSPRDRRRSRSPCRARGGGAISRTPPRPSIGCSGIRITSAPPAMPLMHRDPAGVPAHHLDDHDAVVRLGGRVQPVDRLGRDRHGGVEAERVVGAERSLSIVFGTPTTGKPVLRDAAARRRRACPRRRSRRARRARGRGSSRAPARRRRRACTGSSAIVPRIVPPRGRMPETSRGPSGSSRSSTSPRQPSRTPMHLPAARRASRRTTARMTAFSPGQSPPPVRIPPLRHARHSGGSIGLASRPTLSAG